jgi:hypothetical protein
MPVAANLLRDAGKARYEGSFRVEPKLWHGVVLLVVLAVVLGVAEAAESTKDSPLVVLFRWMPFLLWGQEGHWSQHHHQLLCHVAGHCCGCRPGLDADFAARAGAQRVLVGHPVFSQFPVAGAVVL